MLKTLLFISSLFLLSGCIADGYLKRSANNKLIDMSGFDGGKRRPLYNKKYIDKAKYNVAQSNLDEEEDDDEEDDEREQMSPVTHNRYMYQAMLEDDMRKRKQGKKMQKRKTYANQMKAKDEYPNIAHARDIAHESDDKHSDKQLRAELEEIKSMLSETRAELTRYKCPLTPEHPAPEAPKRPAPEAERDHHKVAHPKVEHSPISPIAHTDTHPHPQKPAVKKEKVEHKATTKPAPSTSQAPNHFMEKIKQASEARVKDRVEPVKPLDRKEQPAIKESPEPAKPLEVKPVLPIQDVAIKEKVSPQDMPKAPEPIQIAPVKPVEHVEPTVIKEIAVKEEKAQDLPPLPVTPPAPKEEPKWSSPPLMPKANNGAGITPIPSKQTPIPPKPELPALPQLR